MKVEMITLADFGQISPDGKLSMIGGGWTLHRAISYPAPAVFSICMSILIPWNEAGIKYPSTLTIADEGGVPIVPPMNGEVMVGKSADIPKGMTQRAQVALMFSGIQIPRAGKYVVSVQAGSSHAETFFHSIFVGKKIDFAPETPASERGN
jgi:hypothetical protein